MNHDLTLILNMDGVHGRGRVRSNSGHKGTFKSILRAAKSVRKRAGCPTSVRVVAGDCNLDMARHVTELRQALSGDG